MPAPPAATPAPEADSGDPYNRETPRGTLLGFTRSAALGRGEMAGAYLDWPLVAQPARAELARQLKMLLDQAFDGDIHQVSRAAAGNLDDGLPPDRERVGQLSVEDGTVDVILARHQPEKGPAVWLFSSETLRQVPGLYGKLSVPAVEAGLPVVLRAPVGTLPLHVWQLAGFFLLLALAWGVAWALAGALIRSLRRRIGAHWPEPGTSRSARTPLVLLLTLLLHRAAAGLLALPLLLRYTYTKVVFLACVGAFAWMLVRIVDLWATAARRRVEAAGGSAAPSLSLGRRLVKVFVVLTAAIAGLGLLGVDLTAALAGLGLGGLAFAFAAKTSIENAFGGFAVLGEKILKVGDFCKIGGVEGTVEDITLFATQLRTLGQTLVHVPNGTLLTTQIENFSRRERFLFRHAIGLRYETPPERIEEVLAALREALAAHPGVDASTVRVRFVRLGAFSLDVDAFAYVSAPDFPAFLEVQEALLLALLRKVAAAGASIAFPSQTVYVGTDAETANGRREPTVSGTPDAKSGLGRSEVNR